MTDQMTDETTSTPAGEEQELEVTPEDMISRGKGVKLDAIEEGSEAFAAVEAFKELVARYKEAEAAEAELKDERNRAIYALKSEHNVSFGALAEIMGVTSSLVLYLYERAQGKTAKQIREESQRSAAAKAKFNEPGEGKKGRKQTPEEKAFRKQQREALAQFLAEQKAANGGDDAEGETVPDDDDDS
jgi:hypothetical protein